MKKTKCIEKDRIENFVIRTKDLSRLLGISSRRIQQLVALGVIPRQQHGSFNLLEAVQGYTKYLRRFATKIR